MNWVVFAVGSAFFAGLTAILGKLGVEGMNSNLATFIRTIVIILALILFLTYTNKWQSLSSLSGKNWLFLILSGLATGASWLAYFKALQMGNASQVAPIDKLSLALVAVFAVVFLGERPSQQEWLGIGLVVAGVLTLAFKR